MASQTIKEKFVELQKSKQTPKNSRPKIQRVQEYLRNRKNFEKHYSPKVVSIGPIHHDNPTLKTGEKYKLMWAAKYIENTGLIPEELHKKIADNIDELKGRFSDDVLTLTGNSLQGFGCLEEKLSWMLFVDGCSFLHILDKFFYPHEMNIKIDQLDLVREDVLLLENQLPYEVLKLLMKDNNESELIKSMRKFIVWSGCGSWSLMEEEGEREHSVSMPDELQAEILEEEGEGKHSVSMPDELQAEILEEIGEGKHSVSMPDELQAEIIEEKGERKHSVSMPDKSQLETPTHLLDLIYQLNLSTSKSKLLKTRSNDPKEAAKEGVLQKLSQQIKIWSQWLLEKIKIHSQKNSEEVDIPYTGIEDLTAVGIRLKPGLASWPTDVDYSEGWFTAKLIIPRITVDDFIAARFLNTIAYEMSPDFENHYEMCSYVAFMDSLIDHPEDVKALRSSGILYTCWSNEEVAKFFNTMGTDLVHNNMEQHSKVRVKLDEHYRKKYKTWIALGFRTYFNNPWAVIAFVPAFIALALTFIQTWFAIHPASNKGG